jgi:hypothetical protein
MFKNFEKPAVLTTTKAKGISYWLSRVAVFGIVLYLAVLVGLIIFENQLVFPGCGPSRGDWNPADFKFEEAIYQAADGTKLVGWYLDRQSNGISNNSTQDLTILVFHGNAENVSMSAARVGRPLQVHLGANVMIAEYRGYGKSEGSCDEQGILQDAEAAMTWLCQRTGKSPSEITLFGHSLGGGPACYLAGKTGCQALLLDRTFDSLLSTGQNVYPMFPIKLLMKNSMRSDLWIQNYQGPLYMAHGDGDTLIPLELAQRLFDLAPTSDKQLQIHKNWGHWDRFPRCYWMDLKQFLNHVPDGK